MSFNAAMANWIDRLEQRVERLEKMLAREFHGNNGYTKGCRCEICRAARAQSMRELRKKKSK